MTPKAAKVDSVEETDSPILDIEEIDYFSSSDVSYYYSPPH